MDECLDAEKYDDADDSAQKESMAYCGFACQSCDFTKVPKGGAEPSGLSETPVNGDDDTPPVWWLTTMKAYLTKIQAKGAIE